MTHCWTIDLKHFLTPNGAIAPVSGDARQLAQYWTNIVVQATTNLDEPLALACRHRECRGVLKTFIESETDAIHWACPVCGDHGLIHGWQGTLWDGFHDPPLDS